MGEVIRVSVEVWESDPVAFHYNPVGYMALVSGVQAADIDAIYQRQQQGGYKSSLVCGEQNVFDYMRAMFPDWKARGLTRILHEHQGGFAWNSPAMFGIAKKAEAEGVRILSGVEVTGFEMAADGSVTRALTNRSPIEVEHVAIGGGPWNKNLWGMLDLPMKIDVKDRRGNLHKDRDMWTFWRLAEGEVRVDPQGYVTAQGTMPPVIHVDSVEPLVSDKTGQVITDQLWGIYWKQDKHGVQGGAVPENLGPEAQVDPYGPSSPLYTVKDDFVDYWTAGLAHCLERFEGCGAFYNHAPSGGIGAFTADSFPVFDWVRPNVYFIADSNHGYKMIGVGKEVAKVMMGEHSAVLHPFRFARFAEGDLHPTSHSPFPWS
jgi:glycine/D-amino acid oxidase-like deaminating enzyme